LTNDTARQRADKLRGGPSLGTLWQAREFVMAGQVIPFKALAWLAFLKQTSITARICYRSGSCGSNIDPRVLLVFLDVYPSAGT
jgi:hypothetical protein